MAQRLSQVGTELGAPSADCFVTDVDAPLEQEFLYVAVREQEAVVEIYRVGDDGLREAVAFGPFTRLVHRASLP